jgi:hypothetical protein
VLDVLACFISVLTSEIMNHFRYLVKLLDGRSASTYSKEERREIGIRDGKRSHVNLRF